MKRASKMFITLWDFNSEQHVTLKNNKYRHVKTTTSTMHRKLQQINCIKISKNKEHIPILKNP